LRDPRFDMVFHYQAQEQTCKAFLLHLGVEPIPEEALLYQELGDVLVEIVEQIVAVMDTGTLAFGSVSPDVGHSTPLLRRLIC